MRYSDSLNFSERKFLWTCSQLVTCPILGQMNPIHAILFMSNTTNIILTFTSRFSKWSLSLSFPTKALYAILINNISCIICRKARSTTCALPSSVLYYSNSLNNFIKVKVELISLHVQTCRWFAFFKHYLTESSNNFIKIRVELIYLHFQTCRCFAFFKHYPTEHSNFTLLSHTYTFIFML